MENSITGDKVGIKESTVCSELTDVTYQKFTLGSILLAGIDNIFFIDVKPNVIHTCWNEV